MASAFVGISLASSIPSLSLRLFLQLPRYAATRVDQILRVSSATLCLLLPRSPPISVHTIDHFAHPDGMNNVSSALSYDADRSEPKTHALVHIVCSHRWNPAAAIHDFKSTQNVLSSRPPHK